ncbi:DUF4365 domain-containing protein [Pedobacter sp. KR3-3]|uniref:DUF4365 domain-containing protein n=1 Tax=Pedobacter albus TaxID=3113905 RepID=A0ABU7I8Z2_9SPHI|nr:DUF4365 domain-containing protein [Pedobacter sp. KR3-3]MEE1945844.1 DUF4365 domain-containing protein [Pedobacter sp. KR3-3]
MAKYVSPTHIIGDSGVIKFKQYCNQHDPYIIFREIKEHDYGVDGEIELVKFEKEKMIASGQIIKVQLKSTASSNSYIKNQTDDGFTFYATQDDFEYWSAHNLGVILVIYDSQKDRLFARKITKEDYVYHKKHTKTSSYPVVFKNTETELFVGEGTFFTKIRESYFKPRFDGNVKETLVSNVQFFSSFPKVLYIYNSEFKTKKDVFKQMDEGVQIPPFLIYNKKIYCFQNIPTFHKDFRERILTTTDSQPEILKYDEFFEDKSLLNHYVELLNLYLRDFFVKDRKLWANRKNKGHFFFAKPSTEDSLKITYKTRKRETQGERTVVNFYEYGKDAFFRHMGFTYYIDFLDKSPIFILNYKYHFTKDGGEPLSPMKITKYTNKLNGLEYNSQVLNTLHFWQEYLSGGHDMIKIAELDEFKIQIKPLEVVSANFGIYKENDLSIKKPQAKVNPIDDTQNKLF